MQLELTKQMLALNPGDHLCLVDGKREQVSEMKRAEQRLWLQYSVSRILADSFSVSEASSKILEAVCEIGQWQLGALWLVNKAADHLHCAQLWHAPALEFPNFAAVSR